MALRVTNLTLIWTIEGWQDTSSVWGTEVSLLGSSASSSSNRVELMAARCRVSEGFKVQFKSFGGKVTAEPRRCVVPELLPLFLLLRDLVFRLHLLTPPIENSCAAKTKKT